MGNFNLNTAGFVIVGMFILTWLTALLVWRYGQIEEKWTARLQPATPGGMARLRSAGPTSPLGPIVTLGTDEALELSRSLGDPVLIGDQQPSGRAPAPGPPDFPGRLALAQPGKDPVVADAGLLGDRACAQTGPSVR